MKNDGGKAAPAVSLTKPTAKPTATKAAAPPAAARPQQVLAAVVAMGISALAALGAAAALYGQDAWLRSEQIHADVKAGKSRSTSDYNHLVAQQQSGALIGTVIVVLAMAFLGYSVYRGRHWSRWGVVAFWFLASFTGTMAGVGTVLSIGSSAPAPFKVPAFVAGAALIAAVVFVNMRKSVEFFALSRPERPAGAPPRRGLFAPRTPVERGRGRPEPAGAASRGKTLLTSSAATRGEVFVQKQRAKNRAAANAEAIKHGAELARSRAKASKSRRIES